MTDSQAQGRGTVLIVDDEEDFAAYVSEAAETIGFSTRLLSNPERFIEVFEDCLPSIVVSDIAMPGFDGMQLVRWMGARERAGSTPCGLIIISGFGKFYVDTSKKLAEASGVAQVQALSKPISLAQLCEALEAAVPEAERPLSQRTGKSA